MEFFKLFKIKDTNTSMVSDAQFIALQKGDVIQKNTGDEYIKVDTNVFDKVPRVIKSSEENDLTYPKKDSNNEYEGLNRFNGGIAVGNGIVSDSINNSGNINTDSITANTGDISNLSCDNVDVSEHIGCKNLDASENISGKNLYISDNAEINNLEVSGYVHAVGNITSDAHIKCDSLEANTTDLTNIKSRTITNSQIISTDKLTVTTDTDIKLLKFENGNGTGNLAMTGNVSASAFVINGYTLTIG